MQVNGETGLFTVCAPCNEKRERLNSRKMFRCVHDSQQQYRVSQIVQSKQVILLAI